MIIRSTHQVSSLPFSLRFKARAKQAEIMFQHLANRMGNLYHENAQLFPFGLTRAKAGTSKQPIYIQYVSGSLLFTPSHLTEVADALLNARMRLTGSRSRV
jgi:hypothetical protein